MSIANLAQAQPTTVINPDEITVFFPRLQSEGNLGKNVATVLSLQLAQTGRRNPWPENPLEHNFNKVVMAWSDESLATPSHDAAAKEAAAIELLSQIVIWGETLSYAGEIIANVNVTLPRYTAPTEQCNESPFDCDYRQANFETWTVSEGGDSLSVGPPRRRFGLSSIVLRPEIVEQFRNIEGLPIRSAIRGGDVLGHTGSAVLFLEYNRTLPGAPTKLTSNGVTGYVTMPEISERASEYVGMIGGILQVFRGDWSAARRSFSSVIENSATRTPLWLDALLYRGMAAFRDGDDGLKDFESALELAPYDSRVVQYTILGLLTRGSDQDRLLGLDLLARKQRLFAPDDEWAAQAHRILNK